MPMPKVSPTGKVSIGSKVTKEQYNRLYDMAHEEHSTVSAIVAGYVTEGLLRAGNGSALCQRLAWLMWCYRQGYKDPADRDGLDNWMTRPDSELHADDIRDRDALLAMAGEILELATEGS